MKTDTGTAPDGNTVETDVCIVGAGPAGLSLAESLSRRGRTCTLLESATAADPAESELNAGATRGDAYPDLKYSRGRGPGGTAALWNSWFENARYAKYVPLDPIDFEAREDIPDSGWPFSRDALEPFYRQAHELLGLGAFDYEGTSCSGDSTPLLPLSGTGLTQTVYRYGPAGRFTVELARQVAPSIIAPATVTRLVGSAGGERIVEVGWRGREGKHGAVRASTFVLAAGALENTRLLLLLARERISGFASEWLGRGFMEHPVDASLQLQSRDPALARVPGFFGTRRAGAAVVAGRIGLSRELLRSERLPNASLRLFYESEPAALDSAGVRTIGRRLIPFVGARRAAGNLARGIHRATRGLRASRHRVWLDLEQVPHRENRVVLSNDVDALGMSRLELQWSWTPADEAHRIRIRKVFARELERAGTGRLIGSSRMPLAGGVHHHAGTTRMHPDPGEGVVDANLRVHRVENLYVAGASVFPTAGVANPTLTVVAMALRLAHHLAPERRPD